MTSMEMKEICGFLSAEKCYEINISDQSSFLKPGRCFTHTAQYVWFYLRCYRKSRYSTWASVCHVIKCTLVGELDVDMEGIHRESERA